MRWLAALVIGVCYLQANWCYAQPVDVALVLAVDVSGSVNEERYEVQKDGYIKAITDPGVLAAIQSGDRGAIALTFVEWSGTTQQSIIVPWTRIESEHDARAVADALARSNRSFSGFTAVFEAIKFSVELLRICPYVADAAERTDSGSGKSSDKSGMVGESTSGRSTASSKSLVGPEPTKKVVDVSGDGVDNNSPKELNNYKAPPDVTVNGLPIMTDQPGLDTWYREYVEQGPMSFTMPINEHKDVFYALRSKLIKEIAINTE